MAKVTVINPISYEKNQYTKSRPRVAAYCRVSGALYEQLQSLSAQIEHYSKFIKSNNEWDFAGIYADEGISGRHIETRNEFIRMIEDCEKGKIDIIITKSISRFARNSTDFLKIIEKLKELGVSVYFEKENLNTSNPENDILLTTLSIIAEEEAEEASKNVRWGIQKRFETGQWKVTNTSYGYKKDKDGEIEINENEAWVVKKIFDSYLSGKGAYTIAKELENEKIEPPRNETKWCDSTVLGILKNEVYIGDLLLQKTYIETTYPYKQKLNKGEKQQYLIKNNHEAIIALNDYKKVQQLLKISAGDMSLQPHKYTNRYVFSSKIICGECGSVFKRQITYEHKTIKWCCKQHISDKTKCSIKAVKEQYIQEAFIDMYNKLVGNYKILLLPMLEDLKKLNYSIKYETQLQYINNQIKELREQSYILSKLKSKGTIDSAFYIEKNHIIIKEINLLKNQYSNLTGSHDNKKMYYTEKIINFIENNKEYIECFREEFFNEIVEKVIIKSPKEIVFKLINELELIEYIERS